MVINPTIGFYIPIIRIPIKGGMTIPNTRSLDPGSYVDVGDEKPTQSFGGIMFIRHEIRIPMRQPEY